ncbi:MAG: hypothetical protein CVV42_17090 [Candidatus Riflebacteria bacterium HGW-Riflebacteria-2]|jgi:tetratricopeptide (TPR) repeat protein|nr:MAG: hypothetical protein CVV42_17090 [Candidatus Riflebacteria bacterium HGW-Riflebacteria-2]
MRRLSAGLLISAICGLFTVQPGFLQLQAVWAQEEAADASSRENAEILFEEALELKRTGNMAGAIDSFARAIRMDRSILANDDQGLIEALKADCEEKLKAAPEDVKILELLGFVHAVCYSDYPAAIACYQKVYDLVSDQTIKDRTASLIERLKLSSEVQQNYQQEVTASLRDERLKSWSEMERVDRFGEESARMQEKSADLAEAYKAKDELANRVPQLEQELNELQSEYDKANRLFYSMSDNALYERRRRRLKDDIAVKEKEVEAARAELQEAESSAAELEKELAKAEKAKDASPVRSYDEYGNSAPPAEDQANPPGEDSDSAADNTDESAGDTDDSEEQPLPTPNNPDFPSEPDEENPDSAGGDKQKTIEDYIDNL